MGNVKSRKRGNTDSSDYSIAKRPVSTYDSTLQKMHEVDVISGELNKHEERYTEEQL